MNYIKNQNIDQLIERTRAIDKRKTMELLKLWYKHNDRFTEQTMINWLFYIYNNDKYKKEKSSRKREIHYQRSLFDFKRI